ncbi:MAG: PVC-type heme-binding CxxCH protein [Gemmatimonadaceae bacterium]
MSLARSLVSVGTRGVRRALPLLVLLASMGCAGTGAPASSPGPLRDPVLASGPRRIEVLFLGHDAEHHPSNKYAPMLAMALAKDAIDFTYTTDPNDLNARNLAKYDAVLLYANHDSITPSQEKALLDYVASGKGFVPIHSASHSFRNSASVMRMMGGQFDKHGTGTFTAVTVRPEHPVMRGLTPFETWDETYIHKNNNPDRVVLQERVEGDRREAWTWVRTEGKGRVFYTAYGHDERTWKQPAFQALVRNGILWAVGDEVRGQWQQYKVAPLAYRETSRIPNYERRNPPLKLQDPLAPAASMTRIQVPAGFRLELFASEPDIVKPIAMAWDERGRLWIAETVDYPNDIHPGKPGRDHIKILEDTDGDGKADKFTIFADSLNIPTSIVFSNGGIIVATMPDFLFLKDTNGDDKADIRVKAVGGWGFGDTHAGPSNLRYGFDNRIWGTVGYSGYKSVQANGDSLNFAQAVYRFRPVTYDSLEHVASFSNNTWGLGFSETNDVFGSTANNTHAMYVAIPHRYQRNVKGLPPRAGSTKIDGHYAMTPLTPNVRQVDVFGGFTAAAGFNLYTARSYPREYWNRIAFVSEPTGRLLHNAILEPKGAGYAEKDGWNLFASDDEWVGPVDAQTGPDGAVWVADWYNFIIQHNPTPPGFENGKGNAYENPLRDKKHGRIYRVVYTGAPAARKMSLSKDRPAELVQALRHDNLFWRLTAQRLLVERGQTDVVAQLIALARDRSVDDLGLNPGALHALWTLHGLGQMNGANAPATEAATAALSHSSAAVRKAAVQVLPTNATTLGAIRSAGLLQDRDAHTRLAAVLVLSQLPASEELGQQLYAIGKAPEVERDEWLSQAVYVAAVPHRAGYMKAYQADIGADAYRALAQKLALEESTPPVRQAQQTPVQRSGPAPAPRPVAERLLRAYVEDVVGPITRPAQNANRFGPSTEPALEMAVSVVKGQMKFSLPNFTVKPGQRVRLTLTNPDEMQHNLVIVKPGTTEAVGVLADALARTPDAAERNYIPPTPDVVSSTKLVDAGQSFTLEFTAPRQTGDYPYICTFPGHWRIMQGMMKVAE